MDKYHQPITQMTEMWLRANLSLQMLEKQKFIVP